MMIQELLLYELWQEIEKELSVVIARIDITPCETQLPLVIKNL